MGRIQARSVVYIDGLNLYYGALKHTPYKWLDIETLFRRLRPHDDIRAIYYFTALVEGQASRQRQQAYLTALRTSHLVHVIPSTFKRKTIRCGVKECDFKGCRIFQTLEEKRTDVAIALQMLHDAYSQRAERFVLASADSDLVPAIRDLKAFWPASRVVVYIPGEHPTRTAAPELRDASDKVTIIPADLIRRTQFPRVVTLRDGRQVQKPSQWDRVR